jgi:ubiquinone/menaquinone biosynthesis C-methylase UbiE
MNNPVRAAHQHRREAAWFRRLAGGALFGRHVLEVGCGRGVGPEVILDRLGAERVTAFDLDESMVEFARRRLHERPVSLSVGDVCAIDQPSGTIDTVVLDMWATPTFTVHPRENRFDADEFAAELARRGLPGTGTIE